MRNMLMIVGVVLVTAAAYLVLQAGRTAEDTPTAKGADQAVPADTETTETAAADDVDGRTVKPQPPDRTDGPPNRIVGRDLIAVPELDIANLERLPPRAPLSKPEARKAETGIRLLHRPVAIAAGIVEAQGYRIRIAGIEPLLPSAECENAPGRNRFCGRMALTAFRGWLRGRAITCNLGAVADTGPLRAACSLGGKDAGAWLVENGWARAEAGSAYAALETAARENAVGMFAGAK